MAEPELIETAMLHAGGRPADAVDDALVTVSAYTVEAPMESHLVATVALGFTALLAILGRLYSRFEKEDVLEAEPRARILAIVMERPGATLTELAERTALSRSALVHHCQMLERHRVLASRRDAQGRRFFAVGVRIEPPPRPATSAQKRVLDLLAARGPLTQVEMASLLGVSPQAVSYHVNRLREGGHLEPRDVGSERRWALPQTA